ncbi:MAG: hypothetical protein JW909_09410 [Planctomycetes bacterium]|nr:hypothetical protein [Planctomycetota bacterium]
MSRRFTLLLVGCMCTICASTGRGRAEEADYFGFAQDILEDEGNDAYREYLYSLNAQQLLIMARQATDMSRRKGKPKDIAELTTPVGNALAVMGTKMSNRELIDIAFREILDTSENWLLRFQFIIKIKTMNEQKGLTAVEQYAVYGLFQDIVADGDMETIVRASAVMGLGYNAHYLFTRHYEQDAEYVNALKDGKTDTRSAVMGAAKRTPGNPFQRQLRNVISILLRIAADSKAPAMLRQAAAEALRQPMDVCMDDKFMEETHGIIAETVKDRSVPQETVFPLAAYLVDYYADTGTVDILVERLADARTPFARNIGSQVIAKMRQVIEAAKTAE